MKQNLRAFVVIHERLITMEPGVLEILGTKYYTYGLGLIFVTPFAIWFIFSLVLSLIRIFRQNSSLGIVNLCLSATMLITSFTVVYLDVFQIGRQVTKLCKEEAGMYIFKKVKMDSIIGVTDIKYWSKYGFKYVESKNRNEKKRYTIEKNEVKIMTVDEFLSKYELQTKRIKISKRIEGRISTVSNRSNGETIGKLMIIFVHGGWADMFFLNLTGTSYNPWVCSNINTNKIYPTNLVEEIIK